MRNSRRPNHELNVNEKKRAVMKAIIRIHIPRFKGVVVSEDEVITAARNNVRIVVVIYN